jgi:DNA-binding GntR family transcriptional regulator
MGAIEDAIIAIESREPGEPFSYRKIAAIYGCSQPPIRPMILRFASDIAKKELGKGWID